MLTRFAMIRKSSSVQHEMPNHVRAMRRSCATCATVLAQCPLRTTHMNNLSTISRRPGGIPIISHATNRGLIPGWGKADQATKLWFVSGFILVVIMLGGYQWRDPHFSANCSVAVKSKNPFGLSVNLLIGFPRFPLGIHQILKKVASSS